jgi:hypothetical protein
MGETAYQEANNRLLNEEEKRRYRTASGELIQVRVRDGGAGREDR